MRLFGLRVKDKQRKPNKRGVQAFTIGPNLRNAETVLPDSPFDRRKQFCHGRHDPPPSWERRSHAALIEVVSSRLFADSFSARSAFFKRA
jgi:hypothetical protein